MVQHILASKGQGKSGLFQGLKLLSCPDRRRLEGLLKKLGRQCQCRRTLMAATNGLGARISSVARGTAVHSSPGNGEPGDAFYC